MGTVDEADGRAWWYRGDDADQPDRPDDAGRPAGAAGPGPAPPGPPGLPGPRRAPSSLRPDGDAPHPGLAAPGRHGWARSDGTYVPSVTDKGANVSIALGLVGIFLCGILLGPAAIVEGVKARRRIAASGGGLSGNARAVVGIVIGAVVTFLNALGLLATVVAVART